MTGTVYLIPTVLAENETGCLPAYLLPAIKNCAALFVENERTARRYLKLLDKSINIDSFAWFNMKEPGAGTKAALLQILTEGKSAGIISEAGCPGVADPGQVLVAWAQEAGAMVKPLVGPNSILLALMASGMNGQQFTFHGYLPIEAQERIKAIKKLENDSRNTKGAQVFIETPYRNNQLMEALVKNVQPVTRICVAADLTAPTESVQTKTAAQWSKSLPELHKRPAIFLLQA